MGASRATLPLALFAAAAVILLACPAEAGRVHRRLRHHGGGVGRLCRHTDYPALCIEAAKLVRRGGAASLAQATITAAMEKAHQAKAIAARIGHGRRARGNLATCQQMYDSALADLQTSLNALRRNSLAELRINLSAVITDVGTCDDGYSESAAAGRSPFAGINGEIHKLASNGLALSQTMRGRRA